MLTFSASGNPFKFNGVWTELKYLVRIQRDFRHVSKYIVCDAAMRINLDPSLMFMVEDSWAACLFKFTLIHKSLAVKNNPIQAY